MHTKTLERTIANSVRLAAVAALLITAGAADARADTFGGGVIVDRDPQNDLVGSGQVFAIVNSSLARAGYCTFSPTDNQDYFNITLDEDVILTVMTVPLEGTLGQFTFADTFAAVRRESNGVELVTNDDAGTDQTGTVNNSNGSVVRCSGGLAGPYSIRVSNVLSQSPGKYALLVSAYNADASDFHEAEPNNGPAFPLTLGLGLGGPMIGSGFISAGGDLDYYAVDMRRGEILAAVTTPVHQAPNLLNSPDTVIDLIGTNGATLICSNDDAGEDSTGGNARGSAVRFKAPADGRYFIKVRGFNTSTTGLYVLTAALFAPPPGTECLADLNGDGLVNTQDLTMFLGRFGVACQ